MEIKPLLQYRLCELNELRIKYFPDRDFNNLLHEIGRLHNLGYESFFIEYDPKFNDGNPGIVHLKIVDKEKDHERKKLG